MNHGVFTTQTYFSTGVRHLYSHCSGGSVDQGFERTRPQGVSWAIERQASELFMSCGLKCSNVVFRRLTCAALLHGCDGKAKCFGRCIGDVERGLEPGFFARGRVFERTTRRPRPDAVNALSS